MIFCGIDEAGYGPLLGPLCVASATFDVHLDDDALELVQRQPHLAPNLWRRLAYAVLPTLASWNKRKRRGIVVADSKACKLPNGAKAHPLTHLERGVLAFVRDAGANPVASEHELLHSLGVCDLTPHWYAYDAPGDPLPATTTPDHIDLLASLIRSRGEASGVRCRELRCEAIDEARFNDRLASCGVKSDVSFELVARLIQRVRRSAAARAAAEGRAPLPVVVVDRQGGRTHYAGVLSRALDGAQVAILEESDDRASYRIDATPGAGPVLLSCMPAAEADHLPVALASMTAKLVRELLMRRFNAYWCGLAPGLRPTAGYRPDGGRWLRDAEAAGLTDLHQICRQA